MGGVIFFTKDKPRDETLSNLNNYVHLDTVFQAYYICLLK